jgi:hypothetical protein
VSQFVVGPLTFGTHVQLFGPTQVPFALHTLGSVGSRPLHIIVLQNLFNPPDQPVLQEHVLYVVHLPLPEHTEISVALVPLHIGMEQSGPVHPVLQTHRFKDLHVP